MEILLLYTSSKYNYKILILYNLNIYNYET